MRGREQIGLLESLRGGGPGSSMAPPLPTALHLPPFIPLPAVASAPRRGAPSPKLSTLPLWPRSRPWEEPRFFPSLRWLRCELGDEKGLDLSLSLSRNLAHRDESTHLTRTHPYRTAGSRKRCTATAITPFMTRTAICARASTRTGGTGSRALEIMSGIARECTSSFVVGRKRYFSLWCQHHLELLLSSWHLQSERSASAPMSTR